MGEVHIVFGPQGAGKSTHSRNLASSIGATRFSIDDWMIELFGRDLPQPLDFGWVMERVKRCERRIWITAEDIAKNGGKVVLDLGFTKAKNRRDFSELAEKAGLSLQVHYITAPYDVRRRRVMTRNAKKGETFSFEVTPPMFDFMEKEFEPPTPAELSLARLYNTD